MAKIEMDVTEYEALKQIEKDLRKSLDKQEEMYTEINRLKQEKFEALEKASKMVVIRKGIVKRQFRVMDYVDARKAYDILHQHFGIGGYKSYLDHGDATETVIRTFSRIEEVVSEEEPSITYKGFEEVKEEVRKEYRKELEKSGIKELELDNATLKSDNAKLRSEVNVFRDAKDRLEAEIDSYKAEAKKNEEAFKYTLEKYQKTYDRIVREADRPINIFNYKTYRDNIQKAL